MQLSDSPLSFCDILSGGQSHGINLRVSKNRVLAKIDVSPGLLHCQKKENIRSKCYFGTAYFWI